MKNAELLVPGLLVAVAALSAVARVINVPYPILLVLGGLGLGFVPGIPEVELDPDLVLVLILPPLLYSAAFFSSLRDLRADLRPIGTLAIGLVLATTVSVAVVVHALIDGLPWAAAFALGAIVSPTDPLAATTIARRLGAPRRFVTIIEGESLINDGTALVAYKVAVTAVVTGSFSLLEAGANFVLGAAGGIAIGLAVGWIVAKIRRRLDDPPVEITISLFTAYAAYVPAQQLGLSGVLASVSVGIFLGWRAPELTTPTTRMQAYAVWEVLVFLLNASLFVLVGLQVQSVLDGISGFSPWTLLGYALAICAVVVATRLVWLELITHLIRLIYKRAPQRIRRGTWRLRLVNSWAGMRGVGVAGRGARAAHGHRCGYAVPPARPADLPHLCGDPVHAGRPGPVTAAADPYAGRRGRRRRGGARGGRRPPRRGELRHRPPRRARTGGLDAPGHGGAHARPVRLPAATLRRARWRS